MTSRSRLMIALISTGLLAYIATGTLIGRVIGDTSYGQLAIFNEVLRLVLDAYVEPVDADRSMAAANLGLTDALDGDSSYLNEEDLAVYERPRREDEADIGVALTRRFTFLIVVAPRTGSPAELAGVRAGDVIKAIDGRHTRTIAVSVGERLVRGDPGSAVKLTLLRPASDPLEITVVRERLQPVPPHARTLEDGTGYLKLGELGPLAHQEVRTELESFRRTGVQRLVLDLRNCAFGELAEAGRVAELFLKGGVVAKLSGRRETEKIIAADASRAAWDQPVAVLVDGGTSGPGEILAAALLDADRGPVVGERTFGRVGVQRVFPLTKGALLLTVAKYNSPKGKEIHGRGVEPSVAVEAPDPGETVTGDPILSKALELLNSALRKAA